MEHQTLRSVVEALIFVAEEPMTVGSLSLVLGEAGVEKAAIAQAIDALIAEYETRDGGIALCCVAGGYQFRTQSFTAEWIARLGVPKPVRLSQAALETLAIVAYRQPLVRADIEEIRGVDCGGVLKTLLERNLVRIVGKRDDPGTPLLYGTTREFLSLFNLPNLKELPTLREFRALEQPAACAPGDGVADLSGRPDEAVSGDVAEAEAPVRPVSIEEQIAMESADQEVIGELEEQIRSLRHLEKRIFPQHESVPIPDVLPAPDTDGEMSATEASTDNA